MSEVKSSVARWIAPLIILSVGFALATAAFSQTGYEYEDTVFPPHDQPALEAVARRDAGLILKHLKEQPRVPLFSSAHAPEWLRDSALWKREGQDRDREWHSYWSDSSKLVYSIIPSQARRKWSELADSEPVLVAVDRVSLFVVDVFDSQGRSLLKSH